MKENAHMKRHIPKSALIHGIIIVLLVVLTYANSLSNEFLSDDLGVFNDKNRIGNVSYIWGEPLSVARTSVNYVTFSIFGSNPAAFRFVTLTFHMGNALLIYAILYIMTCSGLAAVIAGILTAVHPVLVESVVWISAGSYVQYTFFFLLSFLLYIRSAKHHRLYFLSVLFFILSILTSEKALPLSVTYFLYELSKRNTGKTWKRTGFYLALALVWLVMIFTILRYPQLRSVFMQTKYYGSGGTYNPLIQIPTAITSYFELLLWPKDLSFYHSELSMTLWQYVWKVTGLLIVVMTILISYWKLPPVFFFLLLFLCSLATTLTPFKIGWIVAERYVYTGAIAVFASAAIILAKIRIISRYMIAFSILGSFTVLLLMTRTIMRNTDWKTADNLWLATGRTAPSDPKTHNNLGDYYGRRGDLDRAIEEFSTAIRLQSNYADAYHNRGNTYAQKGNMEKAVEDYKKASEFNPYLWQSYQNLAAIYFNSNQYQAALAYIEKAIKANPANPYLYTSEGVIHLTLNDQEKARTSFSNALSIDPTFAPARTQLEKLGIK